MATHASAEKAARQAEKRARRNRQALSHCKTVIRKMRAELAKKIENKDEAKKAFAALLNETQSVLMKAASRNLIKAQTASRRISRLSSAVHKILS